MNRQKRPEILVTSASPLGWIALIGAGDVLRRLSFGHLSSREAVEALGAELLEAARPGTWNEPLVRRLQAYASGEPVDFGDVEIDLAGMTAFQRRVLWQCRKIPYGRTATYGQLAVRAGAAGAARAVGNCMATNRFPLIVPCHRVLPASGRIGAFSAPGGPEMKHRLLAIEVANR